MNEPSKLINNRKKLVEDMTDKFGYIFCQHCSKSRGFKFEVHHIIFRSEKPQHPELHSTDNLIIVCSSCHNEFHRKKETRDYLVKKRRLKQIFNL